MASKRMYTTKVTDSDAFIEMGSSAQALYFHLNQGADDDGFNNQVQIAIMKAHASSDDLKVLMAKNFIIRFENGVIVIKHWRMHNTLRKDRYTETNFKEELKRLGIKENGAYTLRQNTVSDSVSMLGCQMVATDKIRLDKVSIDKNNILSCKQDDVQAKEILKLLNDLTDSSFKEIETNLTPIRARIKEYGFEDLKKMVEFKVSDWKNDAKFSQYLTPKTLFRASNCASYVEQSKKAGKVVEVDGWSLV